MVDELNANGIAVIDATQLLAPDPDDVQQRLTRSVREFSESDRVKTAIDKFRSGISHGVGKEYIVKYYPPGQVRERGDAIFRLGLRPEILDTVNAYLGLWSSYRGVDVLHNIALEDARPRMQSQLWHRDYEDERLVKVFWYFTDVDEGSGPFEYIPESQRGRRHEHVCPFPKGGVVQGDCYPRTEMVNTHVAAEDRMTCCVPAGTIVFCNTCGLHRGGYATVRPRVAGNWMFVTPASLAQRSFQFEQGAWLDELSPAARFALR